MQKEIILIHAFLGCDQTSRLHGINKNKVIKSQPLQKIAEEIALVFNSPNAPHEEVEMAGTRFHLAIMNSKEQTLTS